jgi:nicotinamide riboside transporter PnuC
MWIVAAASLIGTILNLHRRRECFLFWIATSAAWVVYDLHLHAHAQAALMAVYLVLAIYGWRQWKPTRNARSK